MNKYKEIDKLSRGQKAIVSTITSFILEIVTILSALIIPKMILSYYGSEVNGLITSITQFLGYVTLLQMGVGGVVRAELYKPLAENNSLKISKIMKATSQFFLRIAWICCIYIVLLSIIYPEIANQSFDFFYTFFLILIIGASTAAQYFWGFPYRSLVMADQKIFIYDFLQIISVIFNIIITIVLILLGFSIHIVKLGSTIVFCLQPLILKKYCINHYKLDTTVDPDKNAIKQRWNGAGYSLADFVHRNTDVFVITVCSSLKLVSVYSIYAIIYNGINSIINMCTNSFGAAIGDMIAKNEDESLKKTFDLYVFICHLISSIVYTLAFTMIISFVTLYTTGITDVNYIDKSFAFVILSAELLFCLRQPFQTVITSAGHFKQTQKGAFLEAIINIVLSVFFVTKYGLLGVAIGTLISMTIRSIDLIKYIKNNLIIISWRNVIKRYLITFVSIIFPTLIISYINIKITSFFTWILVSLIIGIVVSAEVILINTIFYDAEFKLLKNKIMNNLFKKTINNKK